MKLNNRGFAITGIVYSFLLLFIVLVTSTLLLLSNRKILLDKIEKDVYDKYSDKPRVEPTIEIAWKKIVVPLGFDVNDNVLLKEVIAKDEDGNELEDIIYELPANFNVAVIGEYTVTYSVTDMYGLVGTKTAIIKVTSEAAGSEVINFSYTGNAQVYAAAPGDYKLEVWGAEGGTGSAQSGAGGKGGYATGQIRINENTSLSIYVGGKPTNPGLNVAWIGGWNGGGATTATTGSNYQGAAGGGGTDIRKNGTNLEKRIIVAGGGGGGGNTAGGGTAGSTPYGGYGGGLTGQTGQVIGSGTAGGGGTQTTGGALGYYSSSSYAGTAGTLGQGGSGKGYDSSNNYPGGGGGGGYYGGGGSSINGGGGGSGYVGSLSNATLTAGNELMPSPSGGNQTGHSGNGYAKITVISKITYEY